MAKNWIAGAVKKPGALHKEMGIPKGQKIPAGKLAKAAKAPGKLGQRARLAETFKGFRKGGKKTYDQGGMVPGGAAQLPSPLSKSLKRAVKIRKPSKRMIPVKPMPAPMPTMANLPQSTVPAPVGRF